MQKSGETVELVYNENGLRVQKTATSTGVTKYTLHGKNVVHMAQGSNELHFFYDAQNKPAVVVYNGTPYSYLKNLQGDIVAILDANGAVVVSYVYDAWGSPISKTGTLASTLGTVQPFRYRGYVYDEETGLYYLISRYYNPAWSRFVSSDVIFDAGANLLKLNTFIYVANNPSSFSDSNGNWIIKDAIKWFAKNVVEPVVDACEDLLANVDFTFSIGFTGSISLGFWSYSGSIGVAFDSEGNYGLQASGSVSLTTGEAGLSGGVYCSVTNAPHIKYLYGESLGIGGSVSAGVDVSAEFNAFPNSDAPGEYYYGVTAVLGASLEVPVPEFHIAGSLTIPIPNSESNMFDKCRMLLKAIEEW